MILFVWLFVLREIYKKMVVFERSFSVLFCFCFLFFFFEVLFERVC
jgi:hypothetical protein